MTDYYEILGASKSATQEEIKKAYRKSAIQHHPDKNPGDPGAEKKFKKITVVYHKRSIISLLCVKTLRKNTLCSSLLRRQTVFHNTELYNGNKCRYYGKATYKLSIWG